MGEVPARIRDWGVGAALGIPAGRLRESEFVVFTGAVVRMGREFGSHQPAHDRILDLLTQNGLLKPERVGPKSRMPPARFSGPPRVTHPG